MMYQMKKLPYNYIPDHRVQILELPYVEEELSMFILLPEESTDGPNPLLKARDETWNCYIREVLIIVGMCNENSSLIAHEHEI